MIRFLKNEKYTIETDRLYLRKMNKSDFDSLLKMLMDEDVMYAYNGAFTEEEAKLWFDRQLERYQDEGMGLYAVILKGTEEMIGQCGLSMQMWKEGRVLEIGYLFHKGFWGKGYARLG